MSSIFCCSSAQPYKNQILSHEPKFRTFMAWAKHPKESEIAVNIPESSSTTLVIQLVRQVNYGPLESKRYFVHCGNEFVEVAEQWLVDANFEKTNT
jgi:hypothetical protein